MTLQQIKDFFARPGINMTGFCKYAGITPQYLNRLFWEKKLPSKKVLAKLEKAMREYGWPCKP